MIKTSIAIPFEAVRQAPNQVFVVSANRVTQGNKWTRGVTKWAEGSVHDGGAPFFVVELKLICID